MRNLTKAVSFFAPITLIALGCGAGPQDSANPGELDSVEDFAKIQPCDPFDLLCPSVRAGQALAKKVNAPTHYQQLSVTPGSGNTTAIFIAGGVWVFANFTYWAPNDLLHSFSLYDWSLGTWVSFGQTSAHPSEPSYNYASFDGSVLSTYGITGATKENLILGIVEVLGSSAVVNQGLLGMPSLGSCPSVGRAVNKGAVRITQGIANEVASRFVADRVEALIWPMMGGKCTLEASCKIDLECFINGAPLAGKAECEASKGFTNQCIRQPDKRKVICQEFDKNGKLIGIAEVECRKE